MIAVRLNQLFDSIKQTLFIVGTALTIFLAARNTIVWHMQQFWGASAEIWQRQWANIYDFCGRSDFNITVIGSSVVLILIFWLANLFFMVLDVTGKPAFFLKYKIQEDKNRPLTKADLWRCVRLTLINQTIVGFPVYLILYKLFQWRGVSCSPDQLPTFHWAVFELTIFMLIQEFMFYYSHRLLHHPKIYRFIHKKHHEWIASISVASIYCHPVEHVISNLLPIFAGPLLMRSHLATALMFWILVTLSTTVAHCGYHMPFLPSPEAHDFHHLKFNQNFGFLGVLDRLHGTDVMFRNSMAYQRHFLLLSMVPVSHQFPEPSKKKSE